MIIYDDHSVIVRHYKSIKYLDEALIIIEMNDYDITIKGSHFEIDYYFYDEIKMKGIIKVIEYGDRL